MRPIRSQNITSVWSPALDPSIWQDYAQALGAQALAPQQAKGAGLNNHDLESARLRSPPPRDHVGTGRLASPELRNHHQNAGNPRKCAASLRQPCHRLFTREMHANHCHQAFCAATVTHVRARTNGRIPGAYRHRLFRQGNHRLHERSAPCRAMKCGVLLWAKGLSPGSHSPRNPPVARTCLGLFPQR